MHSATPLPLLAICSFSGMRNTSLASVPAYRTPFTGPHSGATKLCLAGDSCSLDFPEEEIDSEVVKL